ncbi:MULTISPECIES: HAD family hydrolase [Streptomyces]|uniref:HAD family phosphatase n=1 Tax=Streptomyces evansiae TaxID=3075535 RepID=A0ABU2R2G6_9ACTN|nr:MULTISPECIES: HAD family phosphatase [unclassified Streptomyces]ASY32321.1 hydrolase [Streptomyces sp. CLI2509]MDT0410882.1 HAD family phosphatase [Streptomyces sp. DSM 41979]MDT0420210.1 HAD family phosphatase [Streptomyces sp. DSM 41859]MYQ58024.1 HAD-IA family hydrolase [Streptomyces sp. SID4926]MYX23475.1 HAD-IA family hydrolase [Streptomyces sp. SID8380]
MNDFTHPLLSWTPEAAVLDCDGTLVDSERHWHEARIATLGTLGLRPSPGFAARALGLHYADCGRLMAEEAGKPELTEELTAELLRRFTALAAADPVLMPGAGAFVRALAERMPLAVASNCPREVVETSLGRAGLLGHFRHVVVPDAEVRAKPEPDVYRKGAELLGVDPDRALAVEDTLTGVEAARAAGLRVLGVGPRPAEAERAHLWVPALDAPVLLAWVRAHVTGDQEPRP